MRYGTFLAGGAGGYGSPPFCKEGPGVVLPYLITHSAPPRLMWFCPRCKRGGSRHALQTRDSRTHQTLGYRDHAPQPYPAVRRLSGKRATAVDVQTFAQQKKACLLNGRNHFIIQSLLPDPSKHRSIEVRSIESTFWRILTVLV